MCKSFLMSDDSACRDRGTSVYSGPMDPASTGVNQIEQCLNAIYAWSRLLQVGTLDEGSRARALQTIQANAERLLLGVTAKPQAC